MLTLSFVPFDHGIRTSGIDERRLVPKSMVFVAMLDVIELAANDAFTIARMIPMASIFMTIHPKRSL